MRRILTKMEFEVMSVLWEGEGPMSSTDIIMAAPIEFKQSTVQAVLRTLLKEGWIQIGGVSIHTKVPAREFVPVITNEEYVQSMLGKKSGFSMASHLIEKTEDVEELEKLDGMIQARLKSKR